MDLTRVVGFRHLPVPSFKLTPARRATAVLAGALTVGAATQGLFWHTAIGLNFLVWTLLMLGACLASVRPRRLTVVGYGAIASAALLGLAMVRFAGSWSFVIAIPTTLVLLAVLPVALRDEVDLAGAPRLPLEALSSLAPRNASRALCDICRLPGAALGGEHETFKHILKGLAVGLPVAGVFTALLAADVDFGHLLVTVRARLGDGLAFVSWTLLWTTGGLGSHFLHRRPRDLSDGESVAEGAYRARALVDTVPRVAKARVLVSTWVMVVGQVAVVFGAFVAVNARSLFGGHALVQTPGSLTYARYLHAGFGQLLVASVLSICLVLVGHWLLRPQPGDPSSVVPGGRVLVTAECALLGLTAVTVASCAQRLAIYEDAYGATHLRLAVGFVILAVLASLALTLLKVTRRGWMGYGGALVSTFVVLTVVASWVNADAYVACENLDRAARGKRLDASYLSSLSVDAKSVLSHPVVLRDPELARALTAAYCERPDVGWRAVRGLPCAPSMAR